MKKPKLSIQIERLTLGAYESIQLTFVVSVRCGTHSKHKRKKYSKRKPGASTYAQSRKYAHGLNLVG